MIVENECGVASAQLFRGSKKEEQHGVNAVLGEEKGKYIYVVY